MSWRCCRCQNTNRLLQDPEDSKISRRKSLRLPKKSLPQPPNCDSEANDQDPMLAKMATLDVKDISCSSRYCAHYYCDTCEYINEENSTIKQDTTCCVIT